MKKLLIIISDIHRSLAFEWIAQGLDTGDLDLHFLLMKEGSSPMERVLSEHGTVWHLDEGGMSWSNWTGVMGIMRKIKPDIVHSHLRRAKIVGTICAYALGVKHRVYTRHSSNSNHGKFPRAVWLDKLINRLSTKVVSISENVDHILVEMEGVPKEKIHRIPHGFDLSAFHHIDRAALERLKADIDWKQERKYIGVISRWVDWKGVEYAVRAIESLKKKGVSDLVILLVNGHGDHLEVPQALERLENEDYVVLPFVEDISALYSILDVYVHTPIDPYLEAFGQTYVEALAAGVPSIFTMSGIAPEFIEDERNALVVPFKEVEPIAISIERLLIDDSLRKRLISNGKKSAELFALDPFIKRYRQFYQTL